jgi:hypothetical protein
VADVVVGSSHVLDARMRSVYRGVVIEESLSDPGCLDLMSVLGSETLAPGNAVAGQPDRWTLTTFEVADARAAAVANVFSESRGGPWYIDMNNGEHVIVVFAERCFFYRCGDVEELSRARSHARACGVPESQIDWSTPS